ncbi:hypothetical protein ACTQ5K_21575 [Niallia sp. Sow4_A1]|uniref:Phage shock protein B n=1 Tax=Niallia hominis TaxID=3133173 RepID=A0ABV1F2D1_9BACI|nr:MULTISPECIES: hypothetical protein [Bacillaceae]MCF2649471.1 hypothetical protein [Niallia circulans]MCM3363816.1 hypothetical protein [Niallia sp. MER TA 168]CAI9391819.1 hypothetical protein BACSP_03134 [Bacillus sp. T2.9-1]
MQLFSMINLLIFILPIVLILGFLFYLARYMKRAEARADEKIIIEKENIENQKEQINALNKIKERIVHIEKILDETN